MMGHKTYSMFRNLNIHREGKNVSAGLRVFKRFTEMPGTEEYRFVICGEGPLKEELVSLSISSDISGRVDFVNGLDKRVYSSCITR